MVRRRFRNDTEYLMASPENARRLLASIRECEAGKVVERTLIDPAIGKPVAKTRRVRRRKATRAK
jgi:hypothetical protein